MISKLSTVTLASFALSAAFTIYAHQAALAAPATDPTMVEIKNNPVVKSKEKAIIDVKETVAADDAKKTKAKAKDNPTKTYDANKKGLDTKVKNTEAPVDTKAKKGELTAKQAERLVRQRKDVKDWLALFVKAKKDHRKAGEPTVEVERDGDNWLVHVYESMPDHSATFNWYTVDPRTSKVSTMF